MKVQIAEDAWNSKDPERVAQVLTTPKSEKTSDESSDGEKDVGQRDLAISGEVHGRRTTAARQIDAVRYRR
jgi:hypothetical protein